MVSLADRSRTNIVTSDNCRAVQGFIGLFHGFVDLLIEGGGWGWMNVCSIDTKLSFSVHRQQYKLTRTAVALDFSCVYQRLWTDNETLMVVKA